MIPDNISTNNSLTISEPIKIQLSIDQQTMVFSGFVVTGILIAALKIFK